MIERVASVIGYFVLAGIGLYLLLLGGSVLIAIAFPLLVVGTYLTFLAILMGAIGYVAYKFWLWLLG